jgi:hypothetical protein
VQILQESIAQKSRQVENAKRERRQLDEVKSNSQMASALQKSADAQRHFRTQQGTTASSMDDVFDDIDENREETRDFSNRLGSNAGDDDSDLADMSDIGLDAILEALGESNQASCRLAADVMLAGQAVGVPHSPSMPLAQFPSVTKARIGHMY